MDSAFIFHIDSWSSQNVKRALKGIASVEVFVAGGTTDTKKMIVKAQETKTETDTDIVVFVSAKDSFTALTIHHWLIDRLICDEVNTTR